jgi:hypothetical protein
LALAAWFWSICFPSPSKVIRDRLTAAARAASFGPEQGAVSGLAAAARIPEFFAPDAEVSLAFQGSGPRRLAGREEIQQAVVEARSSLGSLSVSFPEIIVKVSPGGEAGVANAVLEARVSGNPDTMVQPVEIELRKTAGRWLIIRVRTVRMPGK